MQCIHTVCLHTVCFYLFIKTFLEDINSKMTERCNCFNGHKNSHKCLKKWNSWKEKHLVHYNFRLLENGLQGNTVLVFLFKKNHV